MKDIYYIIWNLVHHCWEVSHLNNCKEMWDINDYNMYGNDYNAPSNRIKIIAVEGYATANKMAKNMPPFASMVV